MTLHSLPDPFLRHSNVQPEQQWSFNKQNRPTSAQKEIIHNGMIYTVIVEAHTRNAKKKLKEVVGQLDKENTKPFENVISQTFGQDKTVAEVTVGFDSVQQNVELQTHHAGPNAGQTITRKTLFNHKGEVLNPNANWHRVANLTAISSLFRAVHKQASEKSQRPQQRQRDLASQQRQFEVLQTQGRAESIVSEQQQAMSAMAQLPVLAMGDVLQTAYMAHIIPHAQSEMQPEQHQIQRQQEQGQPEPAHEEDQAQPSPHSKLKVSVNDNDGSEVRVPSFKRHQEYQGQQQDTPAQSPKAVNHSDDGRLLTVSIDEPQSIVIETGDQYEPINIDVILPNPVVAQTASPASQLPLSMLSPEPSPRNQQEVEMVTLPAREPVSPTFRPDARQEEDLKLANERIAGTFQSDGPFNELTEQAKKDLLDRLDLAFISEQLQKKPAEVAELFIELARPHGGTNGMIAKLETREAIRAWLEKTIQPAAVAAEEPEIDEVGRDEPENVIEEHEHSRFSEEELKLASEVLASTFQPANPLDVITESETKRLLSMLDLAFQSKELQKKPEEVVELIKLYSIGSGSTNEILNKMGSKEAILAWLCKSNASAAELESPAPAESDSALVDRDDADVDEADDNDEGDRETPVSERGTSKKSEHANSDSDDEGELDQDKIATSPGPISVESPRSKKQAGAAEEEVLTPVQEQETKLASDEDTAEKKPYIVSEQDLKKGYAFLASFEASEREAGEEYFQDFIKFVDLKALSSQLRKQPELVVRSLLMMANKENSTLCGLLEGFLKQAKQSSVDVTDVILKALAMRPKPIIRKDTDMKLGKGLLKFAETDHEISLLRMDDATAKAEEKSRSEEERYAEAWFVQGAETTKKTQPKDALKDTKWKFSTGIKKKMLERESLTQEGVVKDLKKKIKPEKVKENKHGEKIYEGSEEDTARMTLQESSQKGEALEAELDSARARGVHYLTEVVLKSPELSAIETHISEKFTQLLKALEPITQNDAALSVDEMVEQYLGALEPLFKGLQDEEYLTYFLDVLGSWTVLVEQPSMYPAFEKLFEKVLESIEQNIKQHRADAAGWEAYQYILSEFFIDGDFLAQKPKIEFIAKNFQVCLDKVTAKKSEVAFNICYSAKEKCIDCSKNKKRTQADRDYAQLIADIIKKDSGFKQLEDKFDKS